MTIVGVIGCTVLLVSGCGLYEQMDQSKDWYFNDVNHFESKLIVDRNTSIDEINTIAREVNGDHIMESTIELTNNKTVVASLLILNDTDLITTTDDNHDRIEIGNDEVSISKKWQMSWELMLEIQSISTFWVQTKILKLKLIKCIQVHFLKD